MQVSVAGPAGYFSMLFTFTFQSELTVVQKNNGHNEIRLCAVAPVKYDLYDLHLADITFTFSLSGSYCTFTNHTSLLDSLSGICANFPRLIIKPSSTDGLYQQPPRKLSCFESRLSWTA